MPATSTERQRYLEIAVVRALRRLQEEEDSLGAAWSSFMDISYCLLQALWRAQDRLEVEINGPMAPYIRNGLTFLAGDPYWDAVLDADSNDRLGG